jgi:hypothetical protein
MSRNSHRWLFLVLVVLIVVAARGWWAWHQANKFAAAVEIRVPRGIAVGYILTPENSGETDDIIGRDFDVTPDGVVLIGSRLGLVALKPTGDGIEIEQLTGSLPESFVADGQGSVLTISDNYFGDLDAGQFTRLVPLPYQGMRLMPSSLPAVVYLIGDKDEYAGRVYAFTDDGTARILAEVPEPVVAVCDNDRSVYLASEHTLFQITDGKINVVMRLPESVGVITSLAASPDDHALYFATDTETFVVSALSAIALTRDLGGTIRARNGKLYIWSPQRHLLVSLSGVTEFLGSLRS